jgi:hypothetical protein
MATSLCDNNLENISIDKRSNHQFNTNVLLGYPDEIIAEQYVKDVDFSTSKIGGQPVSIQIKLKCNLQSKHYKTLSRRNPECYSIY